MVIPALPVRKHGPLINALHPVFQILGADLVLVMHELASVPKKLLLRPVASLSSHRDGITRALDILLTGF
jgi:toxin CcdB